MTPLYLTNESREDLLADLEANGIVFEEFHFSARPVSKPDHVADAVWLENGLPDELGEFRETFHANVLCEGELTLTTTILSEPTTPDNTWQL